MVRAEPSEPGERLGPDGGIDAGDASAVRFEDFIDDRIDVGPLQVRVRHLGDGPPAVLIHGHPRTGATWHRVAPLLAAAGHTVVVPDMRGYGQSDKPVVRADHSQQSKRAVAGDIVAVMDQLGHRTFSVVGHDRGAVVALRLALDHPDRVDHLAVLDAVPIVEHLDRCDDRFARAWYHWFFYAVPDKPERAINIDPLAWYVHDRDQMGESNYCEWKAAVTNPDTVLAMLEDYRAGLGVDADDERVDRDAGRVVRCPTLALWSARDDLEALHGDPLIIWQDWCRTVTGLALDCGHHMAEEAPHELAAALLEFFSGQHASA